jgi:hypothetical protein
MGTLGLDLVDDDSIVDAVGNPLGGAGVGNGNASAPSYSIDREAPAVPGSVALANGQGEGAAYVNVSTATSVSVTVSGIAEIDAAATVIVRITDGAGASVTASAPAAAAIVTLTGIDASALAEGALTIAASERDAIGNESGATNAGATKDTVAPTQTALASADAGVTGSAAGFADPGDTITLTFSEAIRASSIPATAAVSISTQNGSNKPVTLSIPGLGTANNINALVENEYIVKNGAAIGFAASGLSQPAAAQVRVTLAACSANCTNRRAGVAHQIDFTAAGTLTDPAGNGVTGSFVPASTTLRFF